MIRQAHHKRGGDRDMSSQLTSIARNLRKKSTEAEKLLWRHLRGKQLDGLKFRRQEPLGNYVVDFACFEKRVIIEVDGGHHATEKERDNKRDIWLKEQGFKVLRFWDNEVLRNTSGVFEVIRENCSSPPPPAPPTRGGELRDHPIEGGESEFPPLDGGGLRWG
jgi:very-short-patch-repair endonuclease